MKHTRIYTLAILCLTVVTPLFASNSSNLGHFVTAGASLGYSTIFEDYTDLQTTGAIGGSFSVNYELRKKSFVFTTGLEGQFVNSNASFGLENIDAKIYDTQGELATMHYQTGDVAENTRLFYAAIPIMFGYYKEGFFVGAGAKIAIPVSPTVRSHYKYTTSGTYNKFIEDFENMHHYRAFDRWSNYKMEVPIKCSVMMEVGYNVMSRMSRGVQEQKHGLRISAVCEYGLHNLMNTSESVAPYEINENNATELTILPYYVSHSTNNQRANHFYAGVKITWTFRMSKADCDCD